MLCVLQIADRNKSESDKKGGGVLATSINNKWCHPGHITVKEQLCSPDTELLATELHSLLQSQGFFFFLFFTYHLACCLHSSLCYPSKSCATSSTLLRRDSAPQSILPGSVGTLIVGRREQDSPLQCIIHYSLHNFIPFITSRVLSNWYKAFPCRGLIILILIIYTSWLLELHC